MTSTAAALESLEAGVIGGIFHDNAVLGELPRLEPDDFTDPRNRLVFAAIRNLEAEQTPVDLFTVQARLAHDGVGGLTDWLPVLVALDANYPIPSNVIAYAQELRSASLQRRVLQTLADLVERGKTLQIAGDELLSEAMAVLSRMDVDQPDSGVSMYDLMRRRLKQLSDIAEQRVSGGNRITGYPTGVERLDEKVGGVQPGIVTIVAARPGMGKSSLGQAIARGSSAAGHGVHVFSLEDTEESYADRGLSGESRVPAENMRNSQLDRGQVAAISLGMGRVKSLPWIVDSRSGITADEIVRSVRRHKRLNRTRVVIVDYVQLVKRDSRHRSTHDAVTEIVQTLADAAKQDNLAYVVMSQLNREVEKRQDRRPQLADLRESGSLEERAKCVIGLYRGAYYYDTPNRDIDGNVSVDEFKRTVQLLVLKNSNGRTGIVNASWDGPTTRIW